MNEFTIQAETLRSTAKNLRHVAEKYKDEMATHLKEGQAILEEAQKEADPFFAKAEEYKLLLLNSHVLRTNMKLLLTSSCKDEGKRGSNVELKEGGRTRGKTDFSTAAPPWMAAGGRIWGEILAIHKKQSMRFDYDLQEQF